MHTFILTRVRGDCITGQSHKRESKVMKLVWDDTKNMRNQRKHGLAFDAMIRFDLGWAICVDAQVIDHEEREQWIGPIGSRLVTVIAVGPVDNALRLISLRRATNHEIALWKQEFQNEPSPED